MRPGHRSRSRHRHRRGRGPTVRATALGPGVRATALGPAVAAGAAAFALVALAAACQPNGAGWPGGDQPVVEFDTATARIVTATDTVVITVEVAERRRQHIHGLMERDTLPEDHGMLFLFDEERPADATFHMFRTRIPLDIAFLDQDGVIASVASMEPCESPNPAVCRRYPAGVPHRGALEVNRGFFQRHGVRVGDRVVRID